MAFTVFLSLSCLVVFHCYHEKLIASVHSLQTSSYNSPFSEWKFFKKKIDFVFYFTQCSNFFCFYQGKKGYNNKWINKCMQQLNTTHNIRKKTPLQQMRQYWHTHTQIPYKDTRCRNAMREKKCQNETNSTRSNSNLIRWKTV